MDTQNIATSIGKQVFDKDQARMSLVLIRTDLPLERQMVQACHAASMAGHRFAGWGEDTRMALLAAGNEDDLMKACMRLERLGIEFHLFHEPDHDIGYSAMASAPIAWKLARKALPHLPLWQAGQTLRAA
jgi:hypothetical protein